MFRLFSHDESPSRHAPWWLFLYLAFCLQFSSTPAAAASVSVSVSGVKGDLRDNVLAVLSINQLTREKDPSVGQIHYYNSRAPEEIQAALEPFGFYRPVVEQKLTESNGRWKAQYGIDPGPPLPVDTVAISITGPGADDEAFQQLKQAFPIRPGGALNHALYEQGKARIAAVAYERGYLDGRFKTHRIEVDLERYTSKIDIHYDTGPRYRYGPVRIEQDVLYPRYVEGYVTLQEGNPISVPEMREFQSSLRASPYFGRVEVETRKNEADSLEVPIDVVLQPGKKINFEFGIGVGTDDGLRLSVGTVWRRLNRKGHRADLSFRISQIDRRILANYHIPLPYKPTSVWTISAGYTEEDTDTRTSNIALTGLSFAHLRGLWQETASLASRWEEYATGVDSGQKVYTGPEFSWTKVKADDRIYVTRGFRLRLRMEGAVKPVLSSITYLKMFSEGKGIWSLGSRHRLIGRAEIGYTLVDNFRELPASRRFYAGGAQSIRGYDFESLGPLDEMGNVIGGRAILVGSAEYELALLKQWRVAAFYDWGNAVDNFDDPRAEGAGFGIRWVSPVGMVRGDLAWALTREGTPRTFHLVIGPDL